MTLRDYFGRRLWLVVLSAFQLFSLSAFSQVDATWSFQYFTGASNTVRRVDITPIAWGVQGGNFITPDRLRYTNDGTGSLTVSNMATNLAYQVEFFGPFKTLAFTNYFPPGTTGAVNAADYLTATNISSTLGGYTIAAANAKFALKSNAVFVGTEPTLNGVSFTSLYGGTNGGSGTTYTNNTGAAGVISGSGIGTNISAGQIAAAGIVTNGQEVVTLGGASLTAYLGGIEIGIAGTGDTVSFRTNSNGDGSGYLNVPNVNSGGTVSAALFSGNGASLTNIGTNAMSAAAHEFYAGGSSSSDIYAAFSGMQRDNATLALALGRTQRIPVGSEARLPTNQLHGLIYFPTNGTTRTTNYLLGTFRLTTNGIIARLDSDGMTNLVTQTMTGAGFDYPSALTRIGDYAYCNTFVADQQQVIVRIDPVSLAFVAIATNTTPSSSDGGLTTDGTNLFLTGNATGGYVAKYSTAGVLLGETNTYGGSVNGPPHAGKNLHSAMWDGQHIWASTLRIWSGVVRVDPTTLGFDRFDFDTNHWAFTNFNATDDIADSRDHIWVPGESGNGIIARVDKRTGVAVPIATEVYASGYGAFNDGHYIWSFYPKDVQHSTTNVGALVRIDPDTLIVDRFQAATWVNEMATDGQTLFAGTFGVGTNSYFIKNPVGLHVFTGQANTNGTFDWSFNRRTLQLTIAGQVITNTPATALPDGIVTNNSTALSLTIANQSFDALTDTNTLQSYGAGTAGANSLFYWSATLRSWTNTVAGRYWTNFGDGTCRFFSTGAQRYIVTNSLPIGSAVTAGGSAPPPSLRFPYNIVLNGGLTLTNGVSVTSAVILDGVVNLIGSLTNTGAGTLQAYIAASNILYKTHFKTNTSETSISWEGTASGANVVARGTVTTTNGHYFPSNQVTVATVSAGMTNGAFWMGVISNGLHSAWMSNNVVTWKLLAP
jgi:hypothetical protein